MTDTTVQEAVLNHLAAEIHATAIEKGFWDPPHPFLGEINTKLLLIVSEVAEAQEVLRDAYDGPVNPYSHMTGEQGQKFMEEIADVIIRAYDLAHYFDGVIDGINDIILAKMERNRHRSFKHSKRF